MIVIRFFCPNCGHGPFDVDDNREAPIPSYAIPCSIFHDNEEGRPLHECPKCEDPLPDFLQTWRRVQHA